MNRKDSPKREKVYSRRRMVLRRFAVFLIALLAGDHIFQLGLLLPVQAIRQVEALYPQAARWELDTILQEAKLRHLYEKMGYRSTGRTQRIQEGMDLLFYAKQVRQPAPGQAGQRQ